MLFVDMLILKYALIRLTRTDEFVTMVPKSTHTNIATQISIEPMTDRAARHQDVRDTDSQPPYKT